MKPTSESPPATAKEQIFVRGGVIKTIPESQIVDSLIGEALHLTGP